MVKRKQVDLIKKNIKKIHRKNTEKLAPKEKLSWEAAEFYFYPKNRFWILGIGVLMMGLVFLFIAAAQYFNYSLGASDYLLVIFLILSVIVFGQYGHIEPQRFPVELGQTGIQVRGKFYSYNELKSFWLIEEPNPIMYFEPAKIGLPISALLENQEIDEARNYLLRYLPEKSTTTEHITDRLSHFLRF